MQQTVEFVRVYIPEATVEKWRRLGGTNLSEFVRQKINENIAARSGPSKDNSETATVNDSHKEKVTQ